MTLLDGRAGAGLKPQHYRVILETKPQVGFFEVHAENYMGAGGLPHRALAAIRADYALSVHGVGLSVGGDGPLDRAHLLRLKGVVDRYQPDLVSEHLAWSSHGSAYFNDLLPLAYTEASLARVVEHVDEVQSVLGRQVMIENPSTYVAFADSEMSEIAFVTEMQRRTGCALLLDVNNLYVSAINHGRDPVTDLARFPGHAVRQFHLGGHAPDSDEAGRPLLIDAHDRSVADPVWALFARAVEAIGPRPTLIEWDNDVPDWPVLAGEVMQAEAAIEGRRGRDEHAA